MLARLCPPELILGFFTAFRMTGCPKQEKTTSMKPVVFLGSTFRDSRL